MEFVGICIRSTNFESDFAINEFCIQYTYFYPIVDSKLMASQKAQNLQK